MGQHFLADPGWQRRIFATLPRGPNQWIEIGAGHGEMTRLLAAEASRVVAIEADPPLAQNLKAQVQSDPKSWPHVEVVEGDVLATDIPALLTGNFHVYGNLPYYITSPILHRLFDSAGRIASIHIVIQLEVAERIVAHPGCREYGYLSTICQFYTKPKITLRLPPGAFRPPPKVTSALVQMTLPGERASLAIAPADEKRFLEFIQSCFGQKRKTLRNNLRNEFRNDLRNESKNEQENVQENEPEKRAGPTRSDEQIHKALALSGVCRDARAEQLTLAQFAALFKQLQ
jgi:16S rRNA (adenine1518-N6/adenine1519-N6)-dimethyltransferase